MDALIASIPGVRGAQAYLYEGSGGLAVIDPGYTGSFRAVLRFLAEHGRAAQELRWVILTHHHVDHGGTALALCQATGARLALHADDAPYLVPGRPRERMTGWGLIDVIPAGLAQYLMTCAACETTRLYEGDTIAGLRVIHAPGHTPGSICLFAPEESALFLGDVSAVAALARRGGAAALDRAEPRLFVPLLPMLAEIADDFDTVFAAHDGATALEYKYDGARVQIHSDGTRVTIWSRRLSDVTASLPDVVARARSFTSAPFILDGEVVALGPDGRPLPFQELMRRFRRVHDVEEAVGRMPLALHLFDCLFADGRALIDTPYTERWEALQRLTGGQDLAERTVARTTSEAEAFRAAALRAGHEGVMAKDLRSTYAPGGRGKRWFKLKTAETVDCVIVAADRGSGRRVGWLSNYHLAVVDGDELAEVGKTFKGFTDRQFVEMTERLRALAVADDGYTVKVRPEVVVEVEYNEIQKSPTYPSGLALRFARIARVRDDKGPGQATTLAELRRLYEAQFHRKGRAG